MALEASVGNGYSVGYTPNYAAEDEQIQQGLAHKFDEYTNPFLLAKNISGVFQPGIQNAQNQQKLNSEQSYQQGMLGVEQQRQNLAQTAQDTLLPIQANYYGAQAAELNARAATTNYQLDTSKDGYSQMPTLMNGIGSAVTNNDPTALAGAIGQNPAAVRMNPQLVMDAFNKISQSKQIETQGITGAAQGTGADYVSMNPGATLDDIKSSYSPSSEDLTPAQKLAEKNAYVQGATHNQVQIKAAQAKGTITEAVAEYRQNGQITSATQRALGVLASKGIVNPQTLAAMDVDPDTSNALMASLSAPPNKNGSVIPNSVAVSNISLAKSILAEPNPSTIEKNWAYSTMNGNGNPQFQLPILPPSVQDKADNLKDQISNLKDSLSSRSKSSWLGKSDWDTTNDKIADLKDQLANLKNNNYITPSQGNPNANFQDQQNPFIPGSSNYRGAVPVTPRGAPVVPGNPATTSALQASAPKPAAAAQVSVPIVSQTDMQRLSPDDQKFFAWAKANPNDPKAAQVFQRVKMALGQ